MTTILNFDARTVEPSVGFEAMPTGWYKAMIDKVKDMTPSQKNPSNSFLPIRFTVLDGQYKNHKVFLRLNLNNDNPQAKEIAYKDLSALCRALGIVVLGESTELLNKPLNIRIKKKPASKNASTGEEYDESNEITSYKDINAVVPGATVAAVAAVVIPPAAAPVAATVQPVAAVVAPPVAVAAPARDPSYQYTPDGLNRWKEGMTAWEPVPQAAPPPPPPPPAPPGGTANGAAWTGGNPSQPWTQPGAPAAPAAPAAPPAPPAITGASAPWNKPTA